MRAIPLSLLMGLAVVSLPAQSQAPAKASAPAVKGPFDPARDSAQDLEKAKAEARRTGRRILLDVGGNWCPWCHKLHAFWDAQTEVKRQRDEAFVFVLVNFSKENKNEAFLGQFPKVKGYPHLFVLDAEGKVLHSQDTGELEQGAGYSPEKVGAFLKAWKP